MIKRRFYRLDHADGDDASDSSSSSGLNPEAGASEESEDDDVVELNEDKGSCSTSSGYESEDSSINEVDNDTSDLLSNEADNVAERERKIIIDNKLSGNIKSSIFENFSLEKDSSSPTHIPACVLKYKSVFKCRICPRIVCLNEETLRAHLTSKRHARSEKLLNEGRLKAMLNGNGELETQEIVAESEEQNIPQNNSKRQNKRRKRQSTRPNKKKSRQSTKRKRKNED